MDRNGWMLLSTRVLSLSRSDSTWKMTKLRLVECFPIINDDITVTLHLMRNVTRHPIYSLNFWASNIYMMGYTVSDNFVFWYHSESAKKNEVEYYRRTATSNENVTNSGDQKRFDPKKDYRKPFLTAEEINSRVMKIPSSEIVSTVHLLQHYFLYELNCFAEKYALSKIFLAQLTRNC